MTPETLTDPAPLSVATAVLPIVAEVLDKLATFGSARQIADHLGDQNITGSRMYPDRCPIARYVLRETLRSTYIGPSWWFTLGRKDKTRGPVPVPVAEFILGFDRNEFPELDADRRAHPSAR